MKITRCLITCLAGVIALTPAMAEAEDQQTCLKQSEVTALIGYALPTILAQVSKSCAATLPPDAYMITSGPAITAHYAPYRPVAWPGAKTAFIKLSSGKDADTNKLFTAMPDTALQGIIDTAIPPMIGAKLQPKDCKTIDRFVQLLAPLPAENTSALLSLIFAVATADKPNTPDSLHICQP